MKIKIVKSIPVEGQDHVHDFVGNEFKTVPYREFDSYTRKEMRELGEVAIRVNDDVYVLNKEEYEVIN